MDAEIASLVYTEGTLEIEHTLEGLSLFYATFEGNFIFKDITSPQTPFKISFMAEGREDLSR
jgi:hypothetical protein